MNDVQKWFMKTMRELKKIAPDCVIISKRGYAGQIKTEEGWEHVGVDDAPRIAITLTVARDDRLTKYFCE